MNRNSLMNLFGIISKSGTKKIEQGKSIIDDIIQKPSIFESNKIQIFTTSLERKMEIEAHLHKLIENKTQISMFKKDTEKETELWGMDEYC